jgi:hypothetical protein
VGATCVYVGAFCIVYFCPVYHTHTFISMAVCPIQVCLPRFICPFPLSPGLLTTIWYGHTLCHINIVQVELPALPDLRASELTDLDPYLSLFLPKDRLESMTVGTPQCVYSCEGQGGPNGGGHTRAHKRSCLLTVWCLYTEMVSPFPGRTAVGMLLIRRDVKSCL